MERPINDKDAAAYFWSIFDWNVAPMFIWDVNGKILIANDAFLSLLNYSREDFEKEGLSWKEVPCKNYCHLEEKHMQELRYKKITKAFTWEFQKKDGSKLLQYVYLAVFHHTNSIGIALVMPSNNHNQDNKS